VGRRDGGAVADRPTTVGDKHRQLDQRPPPCRSGRASPGCASRPTHQVPLISPGRPERMRPGVAERMRVQVPDPGVGAAALEHRIHTVCRQGRPAPATQPEPRRVCIWMPPPLAEVAIQRTGGLDSERDRSVAGAAAPARLARYVHDSVAQVDVGDLEAGQLRQPEPAIQEQHDDRRVPARGEVGPGAGSEQRPQSLVRQHRSFRITWGRRSDPCRGVPVGLALALHPPAEVAHTGEPSSGRVAGEALADINQPPPDVLAVQLGRPDLGMVLSQPAGQAPDGVAVGPQRQLPRHGKDGEVRVAPCRLLPGHGALCFKLPEAPRARLPCSAGSRAGPRWSPPGPGSSCS
jgi:hypothetical protein